MSYVDLHPHQQRALKKMFNGCVLNGGVGSGKTITALAYYWERERDKDILVITTVRKRDSLDWETEASLWGIGTKANATTAGVLTVDSWNNISKYEDVRDCLVIFDEQRLVGSGAWVKSFLKIAERNSWILLSATPGDTWTDYIPLFVAHGFYKNRTELLREHAVFSRFAKYPKIERWMGEGKLLGYRNRILVHMPYAREAVREYHEVKVDTDKSQLDWILKKRWDIFEDEPCRDASHLFRVLRKVTNSDFSRTQALERVMMTHGKVIIFYNFDYELEILRSFARVRGLTVAEWNGHKHEEVPDGDIWLYLVQYTAGSEAWNCVSTDCIVFWSLNYSYKVLEQARGRIDRLNTPYKTLHYYSFVSDSVVDRAIQKAIWKKTTFNERRWAEKNGVNFEHADH